MTSTHWLSYRRARRYALPVVFGIILLAVFFDVGAGAEQKNTYLADHFLIANQKMGDSRFSETVIYMCRHDASGAFGLVLNRPMGKIRLGDLAKSFGINEAESDENVTVRNGGPVQLGAGFVLHSSEFKSAKPLCVHGDITVSGGREVLRATAKGEGPKRKLVFFGYSGWGPGQLESELQQKAWSVIPAEAKLVFDDNFATIWKRTLRKRGLDL